MTASPTELVPGTVANSEVLFAVPEDATSLLLEGEDLRATGTTKFVVVEFQATTVDGGILMPSAFRMQAEGEWYSPLDGELWSGDPGEILSGSVAFEVPRQVREMVVEIGSPRSGTPRSRRPPP